MLLIKVLATEQHPWRVFMSGKVDSHKQANCTSGKGLVEVHILFDVLIICQNLLAIMTRHISYHVGYGEIFHECVNIFTSRRLLKSVISQAGTIVRMLIIAAVKYGRIFNGPSMEK
jgi:hypothetical protein